MPIFLYYCLPCNLTYTSMDVERNMRLCHGNKPICGVCGEALTKEGEK